MVHVAEMRQTLADMTPAPHAGEAMPYVEAVAKEYGLEAWQVLSKSRQAYVVTSRRKVWLRLHQDGWSFSRIAAAFKTDHGTVALGVKRALALDASAGYPTSARIG